MSEAGDVLVQLNERKPRLVLRVGDYDAARGIAETIGRYALQQWPDEVTLEWSVERRTGKIFFDHNQNSRGKSLASIFSEAKQDLSELLEARTA